MTLCEELYFEITLTGAKSEIRKFVNFLNSGELDEFFDMQSEYINYDDLYAEATDAEEVALVFTNDDMGIEIDDFDTDEFLEVFCRGAKNLDVRGTLSDSDDEEYRFVSTLGDSYYLNADKVHLFNDELDAHARAEEEDED